MGNVEGKALFTNFHSIQINVVLFARRSIAQTLNEASEAS